MTCVIAENQAVFRFGLKSARTTRLIGSILQASACINEVLHLVGYGGLKIVGAVAGLSYRRCIDVNLNLGLALGEDIGLEVWGISTTKSNSPLSIFASISDALMCTAGWNVGRTSPSAICPESSEPSSSAMPTERLVASVTAPVATVLTEMLKA